MSAGEHHEYFDSPELVHSYLLDHSVDSVIGSDIHIAEQTGGFANLVYKIETERGGFYLKQRPPFIKSRPEIPRVPEEVRDEIRAYEIFGAILPEGSLPQLVHVDYDQSLFVTTEVQRGDTLLSHKLAASDYSIESGATLARLIACIHGETLNSGIAVREGEREQMFYDRQYQWLVKDLPYTEEGAHSKAVEVVERLAASPKSLIWGDLSPKNIILGRAAIGVVDLETVHQGDPAFDLGYLMGHILLEGIKTGRQDGADALVRTIGSEYGMAMTKYADQGFIDQVAEDAIVFSGTSMIHRTLASLVPEAKSQGSEVNDRILVYANNLIN